MSEMVGSPEAETGPRGRNKPGPKAAKAVAAATALVKEAAPRAKALKATVPASEAKGAKKAGRTAKAEKAEVAPAKTTKASKAAAKAPKAGQVPTLTERLKIVIGDDDVGITEAIKRLKARGKKWIPNSGDLRSYVSLALSTHKDDFARVDRGVYRVKKGRKPAEVAEKAEPAPVADAKPEKAEKSEKPEKKSKRHVNGTASEDFTELGNVVDNPFSP
jgi:hypothetical protein